MAIPPGGRVPGLLPHSIAFDEDGKQLLLCSSTAKSILTLSFEYHRVPLIGDVQCRVFLV